MATVVGESGAWREFAEKLRSHGIEARRPNEIGPTWIRMRATYQASIDERKSTTARRIATWEGRRAKFQAESSPWRTIVNWVRVLGCRIAIARLRAAEHWYVSRISATINGIEEVLNSGELGGAMAELDVIANLARLPPDYTVYNDVRLTANRWIHFNRAMLRTAQIDHIVVAPTGVFVIETKRWSRKFSNSGEYHDPFDQVQRAAYLCYDLLNRRCGKTRVRSVIACAGALPSAPQGSYVKVLPVTELVGYISWFKQHEIPPDKLLRVRQHLNRFVLH